MAYLPEELIVEGFYLIKNVIFHDCKQLQSLFTYYKETWINGYKPSSFTVFNEIHRTNNISERHNRELKRDLYKHSTIVEFLGMLLTLYCKYCFAHHIHTLNIKYYLQRTLLNTKKLYAVLKNIRNSGHEQNVKAYKKQRTH